MNRNVSSVSIKYFNIIMYTSVYIYVLFFCCIFYSSLCYWEFNFYSWENWSYFFFFFFFLDHRPVTIGIPVNRIWWWVKIDESTWNCLSLSFDWWMKFPETTLIVTSTTIGFFGNREIKPLVFKLFTFTFSSTLRWPG